jgi:hypothetical protein
MVIVRHVYPVSRIVIALFDGEVMAADWLRSAVKQHVGLTDIQAAAASTGETGMSEMDGIVARGWWI